MRNAMSWTRTPPIELRQPQPLRQPKLQPESYPEQLSASRRASIERWLDGIPESPEDSEIVNEPPSDIQFRQTRRESNETSGTIDTIHPGSSESNKLKRHRSTSSYLPRSFRRRPELLKIPPDTDPQTIARAPSYVSPMEKIDLLQEKRRRKDLTAKSAASRSRGQWASVELESEYRRSPAKVLRQMLLAMVQEMNDDDQAIVEVVRPIRGTCMCVTRSRLMEFNAGEYLSHTCRRSDQFDATGPLSKMNERIQCVKVLAHEGVIMSLSTEDSRLILKLHDSINDLFRFYHGKGSNACPLATTTTTTTSPLTVAIKHTSHDQDVSDPLKGCDTDKLINLIERRLLELVAKGPSRETLRILASRLLEVVEKKKEYEKAADCVDDPGEALKSILADFDRVQGLLRYEF
ncbi:hypothetical protein M409DRAFT_57475 [Zasmidium cellare ATCC 36951]|uniref:Uncharacterized protein n=1 Tax=Zasmidium cellare ATCC 36951 TaxID=1080233 RepID=A0A6A6C8X2_ZASCE|nr:uncharacterized protein M409DRAFT_57475 [Zasmidium cellare ATCC 36951]KAF2163594.1 hypothetical protein M409DRAFT_57475 [Zasmidium cellare ATCC 36951]